jgi:hypothetical protein
MSSYVKATNFATKDTLPTGDSNKIVKGTELDNEFNAIAGAVSSKADLASPALTGTPTTPTATAGSNTTQIANTAYVKGEVDTLSGTLGTMSTQAKSAVDITGGTIVGITDLAVADGGTGASSITANSVILGNGSSALSGNLVAPGTSGNVLTSNGTTWTSAAPATLASGAGTVTNGGTFTFTTGSSGIALVTVQFYTVAAYGNFGNSTGTISISGSSVASQTVRTMEYDSRLSSATGVILYRYSGSANATITVTFSWSGSGSFGNASYISLGL